MTSATCSSSGIMGTRTFFNRSLSVNMPSGLLFSQTITIPILSCCIIYTADSIGVSG